MDPATIEIPAATADRKARLDHLIKRLPNLPGVYKMLGKNGDIIYVGKAKSLKSRVNSYFAKTIDHPKTRALVQRIDNIETIITRSETEALLLEQNLIKLHRPPYTCLSQPINLIQDWPMGAAKGNTKKADFLDLFLRRMPPNKPY